MDKVGVLKLRKGLRIIIVCIALVEALLEYWIYTRYGSVISVGFIVTSIILQVVVVFNITRSNVQKIGKRRFTVAVAVTLLYILLIPILCCTAVPKYSYEEGKAFVLNSIKEEKSAVNFLPSDNAHKNIPVTGYKAKFPKWLLSNNRFYYYVIKIKDSKGFFMVNPFTGEVEKLEKDFYRVSA